MRLFSAFSLFIIFFIWLISFLSIILYHWLPIFCSYRWRHGPTDGQTNKVMVLRTDRQNVSYNFICNIHTTLAKKNVYYFSMFIGHFKSKFFLSKHDILYKIECWIQWAHQQSAKINALVTKLGFLWRGQMKTHIKIVLFEQNSCI